MLRLSEITKYYPENLLGFQRFIIREYLQYKILQIVLRMQPMRLSFAF